MRSGGQLGFRMNTDGSWQPLAYLIKPLTSPNTLQKYNLAFHCHVWMFKHNGPTSILWMMTVLSHPDETYLLPAWHFYSLSNSLPGKSPWFWLPMTVQSHCWPLVAWLCRVWAAHAPQRAPPWPNLGSSHSFAVLPLVCTTPHVYHRITEPTLERPLRSPGPSINPCLTKWTSQQLVSLCSILSCKNLWVFLTICVESICLPCSSLRGVLCGNAFYIHNQLLSECLIMTHCFKGFLICNTLRSHSPDH